MNNVVLDASVALAWLEAGEQGESANRLRESIVSGNVAVWAPDFLLTEVANILLRKKHATPGDAKAFIETVLTVGVTFDEEPDGVNIRSVIDIAASHEVTMYDAQYLYLAKKFGCKVVSFDKKLLAISDWVIAPSKTS